MRVFAIQYGRMVDAHTHKHHITDRSVYRSILSNAYACMPNIYSHKGTRLSVVDRRTHICLICNFKLLWLHEQLYWGSTFFSMFFFLATRILFEIAQYSNALSYRLHALLRICFIYYIIVYMRANLMCGGFCHLVFLNKIFKTQLFAYGTCVCCEPFFNGWIDITICRESFSACLYTIHIYKCV